MTTIDTVEVLLTDYYTKTDGDKRTLDDRYTVMPRAKLIATLRQHLEELEKLDSELVSDYRITISYLESLLDTTYERLKERLVMVVTEEKTA